MSRESESGRGGGSLCDHRRSGSFAWSGESEEPMTRAAMQPLDIAHSQMLLIEGNQRVERPGCAGLATETLTGFP